MKAALDILLIDDSELDRTLIKRTLKRIDSNFNVVEAGSVNQGLTCLGSDHFDVVLLDYCMPANDGIDMLRSIDATSRDENTAVIMLSNLEDEAVAENSIRAGAQDFIRKADLDANVLRRAIAHSQVRFELRQKLYRSYMRAKRLSEHDTLTGLANRYLFEQSLHMAISNINRTNSKLAVLYFDLDKFKHVNDNYGHDIGDQLLVEVAHLVHAELRDGELLARLGGDEFGILICGDNCEYEVSKVAQRIVSLLDQVFNITGIDVHTGASVGIATYDEFSNAETLMKYADIAMYRAKNLGRNRVCFFHDELQQQFLEKARIEEQLQIAIKNTDFRMHYQPIMSAKTNQLLGFEALIRWQCDDWYRSPAHFIPIAEESKLIFDIGAWAIQQSIKQLSLWLVEHPDLMMSINLSPLQLNDKHLVDHIAQCLKEYSVPAQQLEFELTESALSNSSEVSKQTIKDMAALGCAIALDDFGAGCSSVAHLINAPVSIVKIAPSVVKNASRDKKRHQLLLGLVNLARTLELQVTIEGIEQFQHLRLCQELDVQRIQGFFFAQPKSALETQEAYLSDQANPVF